DENGAAAAGRHALRMPARAPLLAHGRVLRTAQRRTAKIVRIADVAADALANVFQPSFADLVRQERIGDGGARRADQIDDAALELAEHAVGRSESPDAHDRLAGELAHVGDPLLERAFGDESRGA